MNLDRVKKEINFDRIKKDITPYGILNTCMYLIGSFLMLPFIQIFFKVKISLLKYIVWYIWSIAYTIYVLYVIKKSKGKQPNMEKVTYNWFIKGGFSSYEDVFLLSEVEPLYEYGLLGVLILIPVANKLSMRRKAEIILLKIAIFHITSSLILMDWNNLVVNYEFRSIDKGSDVVIN